MLELYAHFCRATGITEVRAVATSAIRDATNQDAFLAEARRRTWLEVEMLEREAEARYGFLAAVNSTTLGRRSRAGHRWWIAAALARRRADRYRRALLAPRRGAYDGAVPGGQEELPQAGQGAARARREEGRRPCAVADRQGRARPAPRRCRRGGAQPRLRGPERGRHAGLRRAGGGGVAQGARRADRPHARPPGRRPRRHRRHQAGARRRHPRRGRGDRHGDGARRVRRAGGNRGRPARGRVLRDPAGRLRAAAVRGRPPRLGAQPRRPVSP